MFLIHSGSNFIIGVLENGADNKFTSIAQNLQIERVLNDLMNLIEKTKDGGIQTAAVKSIETILLSQKDQIKNN